MDRVATLSTHPESTGAGTGEVRDGGQEALDGLVAELVAEGQVQVGEAACNIKNQPQVLHTSATQFTDKTCLMIGMQHSACLL